jgi:hypothetical protein
MRVLDSPWRVRLRFQGNAILMTVTKNSRKQQKNRGPLAVFSFADRQRPRISAEDGDGSLIIFSQNSENSEKYDECYEIVSGFSARYVRG